MLGGCCRSMAGRGGPIQPAGWASWEDREKSVIADLYLVCNQGVGECMVMGEVGALGENCGHGWDAGHVGAPEVARAPENFLLILPFWSPVIHSMAIRAQVPQTRTGTSLGGSGESAESPRVTCPVLQNWRSHWRDL